MQKSNGSMDISSCSWKWIPELEGRYMVSDSGIVAKIQKQMLKKDKFGNIDAALVSITRSKNKGSKEKVHVLVLTAFVGPRPFGLVGCHSNDDPLDNALSNLRWDTHSANRCDAIRNSLPERIKKSQEKTAAIETMLISGHSPAQVSKSLHISHSRASSTATRIGAPCRCGHVFGAHRLSCHCGCPRFRAKIHPSINKVKGVKNPSTKLTQQDVISIHASLVNGESTRSLAKDFKVSRGAIMSIKRGESWKWLLPSL